MTMKWSHLYVWICWICLLTTGSTKPLKRDSSTPNITLFSHCPCLTSHWVSGLESPIMDSSNAVRIQQGWAALCRSYNLCTVMPVPYGDLTKRSLAYNPYQEKARQSTDGVAYYPYNEDHQMTKRSLAYNPYQEKARQSSDRVAYYPYNELMALASGRDREMRHINVDPDDLDNGVEIYKGYDGGVLRPRNQYWTKA